ncbi:MAG: 4Fe-4S dicluster domain-containing protein [Calditrichaceae bacterium]|nr:4Fe-4S dicluster domain-containing protein [Calditrichia bacterium]NUQ39839.1 4Fe-4S dicluster domain-containing protein [Calditrichaceae bacterium]
METFKRTIKYEEELDPHFRDAIMALEGGEHLSQCIQCGMCSATCPLSIYMDYPPRRIIAMTRAGFKKEVLSSNTIWLCASCYACTVHCPQNIHITDIMYALKQMAIREKRYPRGFAVPALAQSFFKMVTRKGRSSEMRLVLSVYLKISLFKLLSMAPLGWNLLTRKRLPLKSESIRKREELALIMKGLEANYSSAHPVGRVFGSKHTK